MFACLDYNFWSILRGSKWRRQLYLAKWTLPQWTLISKSTSTTAKQSFLEKAIGLLGTRLCCLRFVFRVMLWFNFFPFVPFGSKNVFCGAGQPSVFFFFFFFFFFVPIRKSLSKVCSPLVCFTATQCNRGIFYKNFFFLLLWGNGQSCHP